MKALTVSSEFAMMILSGDKTIENRTWQTEYRGNLLICSNAKKIKGTIPSAALCVVELKDIVPMKKRHLKNACMFGSEYNEKSYAWILDNLRLIRPFTVKGKLSLWECDHEIEYLPFSVDDVISDDLFNDCFGRLIV